MRSFLWETPRFVVSLLSHHVLVSDFFMSHVELEVNHRTSTLQIEKFSGSQFKYYTMPVPYRTAQIPIHPPAKPSL